MSDDPFLAELKQRARQGPAPPPGPPAPAEAPAREPAPEPADRPRHSYRDRRAVAFWQSEVAAAHIRRRISGDERVGPAAHFASLLGDAHRASSGVSLRAGDPALELELIERGACRELTFVDDSAQRLDYARARIPEPARENVRFEAAEALAFDPGRPLGLVVSNSFMHRVEDPGELVERIAGWLAPGGAVYVDEFVGPDRFQWTDTQIDLVNQLLSALPEELRLDLTGERGIVKEGIGRPDRERFARDHPAEAVSSSTIRAALDAHLEPIEVRPYGGAIYHQLFARIMGNFVRRPEVVRLILEFDAILTERGAVESDYLWAAYRKPG